MAQLDDRDLAHAMTYLELDGRPVADEALLAWIDHTTGVPTLPLTLTLRDQRIAVQHIKRLDVARHFGFERAPTPPPVAA